MAVRSSTLVLFALVAITVFLHMQSSVSALARGSVRLGEVIPALAQSPAGDVVVSDAPPPGAKRRVSRREIVKALRQAGLNPVEFRVPRSVMVSRRARELDRDAATHLVAQPLQRALAPCEASEVRVQGSVRVPEGELDVELPRRPKLRSGRMSFVVAVVGDGATVRIPVTATLVCPAAAVKAGGTVKLVVNLGAVRASATGKAQQSGRVGDVVRVKNLSTGALVTGRVMDSQRVEVTR